MASEASDGAPAFAAFGAPTDRPGAPGAVESARPSSATRGPAAMGARPFTDDTVYVGE